MNSRCCCPRGRYPSPAPAREREVQFGVVGCRHLHSWEKRLVPRRSNQLTTCHRVPRCQLLGVTHAKELRVRLRGPNPSWPEHGDDCRLGATRRDVDSQPADLSPSAGFEVTHQQLNMPAMNVHVSCSVYPCLFDELAERQSQCRRMDRLPCLRVVQKLRNSLGHSASAFSLLDNAASNARSCSGDIMVAKV
jgi:hypothetical protein